jgi:hypothetical protein
MVFFGTASLERALTHYHEERNHQGLQNHLLKCSDGHINPGERLGCGAAYCQLFLDGLMAASMVAEAA